MTDKPGTSSSSSSSPPLKAGPLATLVLCPECRQQYDPEDRKPTVLNCGHTFCLLCLFNVADNSSVVCPTCSVTSVVQPIASNMGLPVNHVTLSLLGALCSRCYQSAGVRCSARGQILLCGACAESDLRDFRSDLRTDLIKLQTAAQEVTSHGAECEQALGKEVKVLVEEVEKNTSTLITRLQDHGKQMIQKLMTYRSSTRDLIQKASQTASAVFRSCPDLVADGDKLLSASQLDLTAARKLHHTCLQQQGSVEQANKQLKLVHSSVQLAKERKVFVLDKVLLQEDIDKLNKKREATQQTPTKDPSTAHSPSGSVTTSQSRAATPGEEASDQPEKKRRLSGEEGRQTPVSTADSGSVPNTDYKVSPAAADQLRQMYNLAKQVLVKPDQGQA